MARRGKLWSQLDLREGDVLAGKYRVEAVLGSGGMGVVLRAKHLVLKDRVALKILQKGATKEAAERFFREAQAAARIKSPHVARVLDVERLPSGSPYIVMEYLDGRDLGRVLAERGPLPIEEAARYVLEACEALAAAHALGVIHRDVKPSNLFLTRDTDGTPTVKVVDFGVSKQTRASEYSSLTGVESAIGTPSYMSPEQVKSSKSVDVRSDIWSLGVVLHELLSARLPFDADSLAGLVALLVDPYALAPPVRDHRADIPGEIEAVILRCLAKEPGQRFPDVAALAVALSPFADADGAASAARTARILASSPTTEEPVDSEESDHVNDTTTSQVARAPDTVTDFSSTRWPWAWPRRVRDLRKYWIPAAVVAFAGLGAALGRLGSRAPSAAGSAATSAATTAGAAPSPRESMGAGQTSPVAASGNAVLAEPVQIQDLPLDRRKAPPSSSSAWTARAAASSSARPPSSSAPRPSATSNDDLSNPYELLVNPYK